MITKFNFRNNRCIATILLLFTILCIFTACDAPDYEETTVRTPNGTIVKAYRCIAEADQNDLDLLDKYVEDNYPNAIIVRKSTQYYNCHSYAWHSTSASNDIWINAPEQEKYWKDGSYAYVTSANHSSDPTIPSAAAVSGYRVRYVNDDQSARVYSSTLYISKWGPGPLVRHKPNYSPYDNSLMYYYKPNY